LQSTSATRLLARLRVPDPLPDSIVLVEDDRVFTRSTAALRIGRRLTFPWPLTAILLMLPRPLRDWLYDVVSRHRYRWFGRRDACMVPTDDVRSRFLE
jgi:predicted DCC family thiol-disulfide oxidoreductase YuxK